MKLAVLIDAENVLPAFGDAIFSHAAATGTVVVKEIFGVASALTTWVEPVLKYAIHPNLTIRASKGKNTSDIALVIGAMDLLVSSDIDGVVIASSDSDFSALSVRLRTAGLQVIGMGTEKANALWRTACSSFVVLEQPTAKASPKAAAKAAAPAAAPQPAQQQAAAAKKQPQQRKSATGNHRERAEAIGQVIRKRLDSNGGRLEVSTLFPVLNKLPEYRADRQSVGKKPLNYLTSTFGERFDFETSEDGKTWVSLRDGQSPAAEKTPAPEAEEIVVEDIVPEDVAVEDITVEDEVTAPEEDAAAPEAVPDETPEAAEETPSGEADLALRLLVEGGMDREVAENIVRILSTSADKRAAYNAIRRVYGSTDGRLYYNQAKEILENRES